MNHAVGLVGLVRTPVGRLGGNLARFEAFELQRAAFAAVRQQFEGVVPDEVIVGNVRNSIGNVGRVAALAAGVPVEVPAMTVDRQCASSMEALAVAGAKIGSEQAAQVLVGGVESASRCPWMFEKTSRAYSYFEPKPYRIRMSTDEAGDPPMGETAETLADEFGISREEMDAFALESHRKAAASAGVRREEFAATLPHLGQVELDDDEGIRADSSMQTLGKLKPVFRKDGRVTAGNSSPLNDGAAGCLALSRERVRELGVRPEAWLTGVATVGYDPRRMGLGPAVAIPKLLGSLGLGVEDVDLWEINEAFAAQVLAVLKKLDTEGFVIPRERLNVRGGAVALGHPLGATGLRLVVTLVHGLRERGLKRGVAALCVGGGQGMAVMVEREE